MTIIQRYRHHHDHCQDSAEHFLRRAANIAAEPPAPLAPLAGRSSPAAADEEGEGAAAGEGGGEGRQGEEADGGAAEADPVAVGADDEAVSWRGLVF